MKKNRLKNSHPFITGCFLKKKWGECRIKRCRIKDCWLKNRLAKLGWGGFLNLVFPEIIEGLPAARKDALRKGIRWRYNEDMDIRI